jgi:hypothetical protein
VVPQESGGVAEVLPLLHLHGLSTGDFVPALAEFFGSAAGLSASAITPRWGACRLSLTSRWRPTPLPEPPPRRLVRAGSALDEWWRE